MAVSTRAARIGDVHLAVDQSAQNLADIICDIEKAFPARSKHVNHTFEAADQIVHAQMKEIQSTLITYPPCLTLDRRLLHQVLVLKLPLSEIQRDLQHTIHQNQLDDIEQIIHRPKTRSQSTPSPHDADNGDAENDYSKLERYFEIARRYAITFILCLSKSDRRELNDALVLEWFDHIHDDDRTRSS